MAAATEVEVEVGGMGGRLAQEAQKRNKEPESTGRGSVGVRAHTDRCLRCESLPGL